MLIPEFSTADESGEGDNTEKFGNFRKRLEYLEDETGGNKNHDTEAYHSKGIINPFATIGGPLMIANPTSNEYLYAEYKVYFVPLYVIIDPSKCDNIETVKKACSFSYLYRCLYADGRDPITNRNDTPEASIVNDGCGIDVAIIPNIPFGEYYVLVSHVGKLSERADNWPYDKQSHVYGSETEFTKYVLHVISPELLSTDVSAATRNVHYRTNFILLTAVVVLQAVFIAVMFRVNSAKEKEQKKQ